jgi:hypothetical protein
MNGGPAFPYSALSPDGPAVYKDCEGMTLRDYFAAKAMVADIGAATGNINVDALCKWSYEVADAMLKARKP